MGEAARVSRDELAAHHTAGWGWALHCCEHRREEAEEVLQASYLKLLEGKARFEGRSTLRSFLFGVIRRTASEHRRARILRGGLLDTLRASLAPAATAQSPEETTAASTQAAHLRAMLAHLSRRQRDLLHLVFYQELTVDQSAEVLGISVGSARRHYHRGKARLRQLLTEPEQSHVPIRT